MKVLLGYCGHCKNACPVELKGPFAEFLEKATMRDSEDIETSQLRRRLVIDLCCPGTLNMPGVAEPSKESVSGNTFLPVATPLKRTAGARASTRRTNETTPLMSVQGDGDAAEPVAGVAPAEMLEYDHYQIYHRLPTNTGATPKAFIYELRCSQQRCQDNAPTTSNLTKGIIPAELNALNGQSSRAEYDYCFIDQTVNRLENLLAIGYQFSVQPEAAQSTTAANAAAAPMVIHGYQHYQNKIALDRITAELRALINMLLKRFPEFQPLIVSVGQAQQPLATVIRDMLAVVRDARRALQPAAATTEPLLERFRQSLRRQSTRRHPHPRPLSRQSSVGSLGSEGQAVGAAPARSLQSSVGSQGAGAGAAPRPVTPGSVGSDRGALARASHAPSPLYAAVGEPSTTASSGLPAFVIPKRYVDVEPYQVNEAKQNVYQVKWSPDIWLIFTILNKQPQSRVENLIVESNSSPSRASSPVNLPSVAPIVMDGRYPVHQSDLTYKFHVEIPKNFNGSSIDAWEADQLMAANYVIIDNLAADDLKQEGLIFTSSQIFTPSKLYQYYLGKLPPQAKPNYFYWFWVGLALTSIAALIASLLIETEQKKCPPAAPACTPSFALPVDPCTIGYEALINLLQGVMATCGNIPIGTFTLNIINNFQVYGLNWLASITACLPPDIASMWTNGTASVEAVIRALQGVNLR